MSATITSNQGTTTTTSYRWTGTAGASASTQSRSGQPTVRNESVNPVASTNAWRPNNNNAATATQATLPSSPPGTRITTGTMGQSVSATPALLSIYDMDGLGPASTVAARSAGVWVLVNASGYTAKVGTLGDSTPLTANVWTFVRSQGAQSGANGGSLFVNSNGTPAASDRAWATASITFYGETAPTAYFDGNTSSTSTTNPDTTAPLLVLGYETSRRSQNIYHDVLGGGQDITLRPAGLRTGTLRLLYADEPSARDAVAMHAKAALLYFADPDRPVATMYYATDGDVRLALHEQRELWTVDVAYREVLV